MKPRWNFPLWAGFLIVLAALVTYAWVFAWYPATRDLPWATLLLFGAGLALTALGTLRAYRQPHLYRGKLSGPILMSLGAGLFALFGYAVFYQARQLPASGGAPRPGQRAPDFTLPDVNGSALTLSDLLGAGAAARAANGVLLIFYRGYW